MEKDYGILNPEEARLINLLEKSEYFNTIKDKKTLAQKLINVYNINIGAEIKKADLWLFANPHKRYKNYSRFLVNWLGGKDNFNGR